MSDLIKNEKVILTRRKHWFVLFSDLLGPSLLAIIPFVIYPYIEGREFLVGTYSIVISLPLTWITYLGSIWLLIFWMRIVGIWIDYYLDVWVITNKHILDREQRGFFNRKTSVFRLENIQDITTETRGFIPTFFLFGDIHVQTAGESEEFVMHGISNPKYVREIILQAQNETLNKPVEEEHRTKLKL